ncbi:hypothetical protein [Vulcanisaeta sp. JCM 16161]|uniref:hypothetical protein n=1 Tax=Vulcanisaeta sp. JCM 16161 TaxID=1295372 RepID=UPI0006CFCD5C|nr:hypothetical protein [Vulcanisaeta sp. JCM 16161]
MTTGIRELLGRHQLVVMRLIRNGHQYLGVPIDETSTKVLNSLIGAMVNATIAGSDDEPYGRQSASLPGSPNSAGGP